MRETYFPRAPSGGKKKKRITWLYRWRNIRSCLDSDTNNYTYSRRHCICSYIMAAAIVTGGNLQVSRKREDCAGAFVLCFREREARSFIFSLKSASAQISDLSLSHTWRWIILNGYLFYVSFFLAVNAKEQPRREATHMKDLAFIL